MPANGRWDLIRSLKVKYISQIRTFHRNRQLAVSFFRLLCFPAPSLIITHLLINVMQSTLIFRNLNNIC